MRLSLGICVTFFCFSILIAFGQKLTPVYENITDGLPSTEVHDMFQDTIGYMWFATDRGICKYDGDRFQTIEIESYLKTKVVFKFFKQKENKVWVVSGKKRLYWFNPFENKPKFHGNEFNDELERILENSRYSRNISTIYFRGDTILVLFRLSPGYIKITPKNGCLLQDGQEDASLKVLFSNRIIIKNTNSFSYVQYSRGLKDTLLRGYVELNKERIPIPKWKVSDNKYDYGVSCELNTPQGRLTAISDLLILSKNGKIESIQLPSQILCMSQVNNNFLIGTYKGIFLVNMNLKILGHFLNPYSITKILKDTDNVYWISTLQNGVYIIPDFNTNEFILPYEFRVSKIFVGSENLFFHDKFKAKAVLYDFEKQTIKEYSDVTLIRDRVKFKDRGLIDLLNLKRKYSFLDETETKNHQFFNESSHDEIFFIESGSIYSYNTPKYRLFFQNKTKHCFKFCFKFNHENLFIGTENGAFFFNLATKKLVNIRFLIPKE